MAKQTAYGLKEVADVVFYDVDPTVYPTAIASDGTITWAGTTQEEPDAIYTFDSLKVSNLEVTAEETSTKGGKGNPELVVWQYGKELTLSCEDALLSMDTLKLMFGGDGTSTAITIDGKTFNQSYAIVGKTTMRSYATGLDEAFLFFIPKGYVNVGGTLTMQAEGDPSTFEMTIKAQNATVGSGLTAKDDVLIEFIKQSA